MTSSKLLGYESLKCVMRFLDVNSRLFLTQRCPPIRTIDAMFPWKIDKFHLEKTKITVNNTTYQIGIIRQYNNEKTPEFLQKENDNGGVSHDVDKYGLKDLYYEVDENQLSANQTFQTNNMIDYQRRLEKLEKERDVEKQNAKTEYEKLILRRFDEEINELRAKVLPFDLHRQSEDPPYTHYIKLTITSGTDRKVEYLEYNRKLPGAMQYLIGKLFSGRRNIAINHLKIFPKTEHLKLRSEFNENCLTIHNFESELCIIGVLKALRPLLADESAPLKSVKIKCIHFGSEFFNDPIIKTAEKLIVSDLQMANPLLTASNLRIHIIDRPLLKADFMAIVENWQNNEYKIGKHYSVETKCQGAAELINQAKELPGARIQELMEDGLDQFPQVTLPLNHFSELNFFVERVQPNPENYGYEYHFNMRIQAIE